jgi:hypothetical protein
MIHDVINILLIVVLANTVYAYIGNKDIVEHMDMSMFASDGKPTNTSKLKKKLESFEKNLLVNRIVQLFRFLKVRDRKAVFDVLSPPEQRVEAQQYPDVGNPNLRLNVRTRGEPDDYQLVGLLYNKDINKNYQLFGRRVYPGSYEWEYYVRGVDVGGLDFKFPIDNKKQEIIDDSTINIPIDNNMYRVKIYNFDYPRYNPFMY